MLRSFMTCSCLSMSCSGASVLVGLELTLVTLWYHGVIMTPALLHMLNIPKVEIMSFHLALHFLCRFLLTASIHES